MLFLAPQAVASLSVQSGNDWWPVLLVWVLGGLILYRLGRLHIPLVFLAVFVPLSFLRSHITKDPWQAELAPLTWPMFQLYIFFMITDPKTTTQSRWSQIRGGRRGRPRRRRSCAWSSATFTRCTTPCSSWRRSRT